MSGLQNHGKIAASPKNPAAPTRTLPAGSPDPVLTLQQIAIRDLDKQSREITGRENDLSFALFESVPESWPAWSKTVGLLFFDFQDLCHRGWMEHGRPVHVCAQAICAQATSLSSSMMTEPWRRSKTRMGLFQHMMRTMNKQEESANKQERAVQRERSRSRRRKASDAAESEDDAQQDGSASVDAQAASPKYSLRVNADFPPATKIIAKRVRQARRKLVKVGTRQDP